MIALRLLVVVLGCGGVVATALPVVAQQNTATDIGTLDATTAAKPFKSKQTYSPAAAWNYPSRVYWGDTHVHTSASMDAGAFGNRLGFEDAYRFARGEELTSSTGQRVKLSRPLDFLAIADHSDNMGFFPALFAGKPEMLADPTGKRWYDMVKAGGEQGVKAALEIIDAFSRGTFPKALMSLPGSAAYTSTWKQIIAAAEKYNDPGRFTAFIGYDGPRRCRRQQPAPRGIYRDGGDKASRPSPHHLSADRQHPPKTLEGAPGLRAETSGRVLAIAHNGNLSNG